MKVVGVVGSPRKGMSTDTLVTRVLEGAQSIGPTIEKTNLSDLGIAPFRARHRSLASDCWLYRDGMETKYSALETADTLVIGTAAYYDSVGAQPKLLIDRSNCLAKMARLADGKVIFKSWTSRGREAHSSGRLTSRESLSMRWPWWGSGARTPMSCWQGL